MWVRDRTNIPPIADAKIVRSDFIVAESLVQNFSFSSENSTGKSFLSLPALYIFKVHRNHPMGVTCKENFVHIYPAKELQKIRRRGNVRMPGDVHRDRMDYDLSTFVLVPFELKKSGEKIQTFPIKDGFMNRDGSLRDASLYYIEHGTHIACDDYVRRLSEVMHSQVGKHIYSWLQDGHKIFTRRGHLESELEGRIEIDFPIARELTCKIIALLEERYQTRLGIY